MHQSQFLSMVCSSVLIQKNTTACSIAVLPACCCCSPFLLVFLHSLNVVLLTFCFSLFVSSAFPLSAPGSASCICYFNLHFVDLNVVHVVSEAFLEHFGSCHCLDQNRCISSDILYIMYLTKDSVQTAVPGRFGLHCEFWVSVRHQILICNT